MASSRKSKPTHGAPFSRSGGPSEFEDVPLPLPPRMRDRYGDDVQGTELPPTSRDVAELKDALRAAGVREFQLMTLTRLQLESQSKLTTSIDRMFETQVALTKSVDRMCDTAVSLDKAITQLGSLLGSSTVPATRGAYADVTPGGITPSGARTKTAAIVRSSTFKGEAKKRRA